MVVHEKQHSPLLQAHVPSLWLIIRLLLLVVLACYYNPQVTAFTMSTTTTTTTTNPTKMSASVSGNGAVLVVGSANQDLTCYTTSIPVLGQTVLGNKFETSPGGKGANQAIAAASILGSFNHDAGVTMICRVGQDVFGHDLLANYKRRGVQYDPEESTTMLRDDGPSTGVATIMVDETSGDNMIIVTPGANLALTPEAVQVSLEKYRHKHHHSAAAGVVVLLVQLEIPYDACQTC
jgi:sugar/nucleoside kinase (ribokinase family)